MKKYYFLIAFYCFFSSAKAQFSDDFSDGNLSSNPEWRGDMADFIVNGNGELQLQTMGGGSSALFLPTQFPDSAVWEIYTKLDFAPSTSNQLRIYLITSDSTLNQGNGYFLEVGETGSNDAIHFYRLDGSSDTLLASGTLAAMGGEPALARIRVTRRLGGEWTLAADYDGGNLLEEEFTILDDTYAPTDGFFAIACTYSASRSDKFFFDNISLQPILPDTVAPEISFVQATDAQHLTLNFNEALDSAFVINPALYEVDGGIGRPSDVFFSSSRNNEIELEFAEPFVSGNLYSLSIEAVADISGNQSASYVASFIWVKVETAEPFDILINEIMADPTRTGGTTIGLPDQEFIELYNRSDKVINLEGMTLEDPGGSVVLPAYLLYPKDYLIVYEAGLNSFTPYGDTLALPRFLSLSNAGDEITIRSSAGEIIHAVAYEDDWYRDGNKAEGGWTLELIGPNNSCIPGALNWSASTNPNGGTPGQANSVLDQSEDVSGPVLLRVFPPNSSQLEVFFNESIDRVLGTDPGLFAIQGIDIIAAEPQAPQYTSILLSFSVPLEPQQIYTLRVSEDLSDCLGNMNIQEQSKRFGLPELPNPGDIILNELLYYPETGGSRFVELFNPSEKTVNVKGLVLARRTMDGFIEDAEPVQENYLLLPDSFCLLSPSPLDIAARYEVKNPSAMIQTGMPAYDNQEDQVVLYLSGAGSAVIIDELAYDRSFPYALLDNQRGVSLERINPFTATQSVSNWHSAAASVGYATPTYINSQYNVNVNTGADLFSLTEKKVSPDNDGFQDVLLISYATEQPGFIVNIDIYDSQGRQVRQLGRSLLLGTQGNIKWDGLNNDGERLPLGIYIIQLEAIAPDGRTITQRLSCIVAYPLE